MAFYQELQKVGLPDRWLTVFNDQLGVTTLQGLRYVGIESYPLLIQFVNEPEEKVALRKFLKIEGNKMQGLTEQNRRFLGRKRELAESVENLKKMHDTRKYRQDDDVKVVENHCRELLLIPESSWVGKECILGDLIEILTRMMECIEQASEDEDLNELAFLLQISGGLSYECIGGIVLKGVRFIDELNFILQGNSMLKVPNDTRLNLPMRPQFTEVKCFKSRKEEEEFLYQIAKSGCARTTDEMVHKVEPTEMSESYCSTIKYCFVPIASSSFDKHELLLSDHALSYLSSIDQKISENVEDKTIEKCCEAFFKQFGSHCFQGPFHFGGIYLCKCFSTGFAMFDKFTELKKMQHEAIDAQMQMCFSPCYEETCISRFRGISGPIRLKKNTQLQVITVGGPERAVGFPDWKNSLSGSNKRWKLIDCGISQVPVWDIISFNHKHHFKNAETLESALKRCWRKCIMNNVEGTNDSLHQKFAKFAKSLQLKQTSIDTQLNMIRNKRREVEQQMHDPKVWALHFLPYVKEYLCSIVRTCDHLKLNKIKSLFKDVVEPLDLILFDIFPSNLVKYAIQTIYDSEKELPLLLCDDFVHFSRYIKQALKTMSSVPDMPHPHTIALANSLVEKAVFLLRQYLLRTGQVYEECMLLTMLHPYEYNPKSGTFLTLVSRKDIEILDENFKKWYHNILKLLQENELQKQSYLMYLTVFSCRKVGAREECIRSHVELLQKKLKLVPEILSFLGTSVDWDLFENRMKIFKDTLTVPQSIIRQEFHSAPFPQKQPYHHEEVNTLDQQPQHPLMEQQTPVQFSMSSQPQKCPPTQPSTTPHELPEQVSTPHGLPKQVNPPHGLPQQGNPPHGLPQQVSTPHGLPEQVSTPHGLPEQVSTPHGLPQQVSTPHGLPQQVSTPHGLPEQVSTPHGLPQQVSTPHGLPQQVSTPHGLPQQVSTPHGLPEQVSTPHGLPELVSPSHGLPQDVSTPHGLPEQVSTPHGLPELVSPSHRLPQHVSTPHGLPQQDNATHGLPELVNLSHGLHHPLTQRTTPGEEFNPPSLCQQHSLLEKQESALQTSEPSITHHVLTMEEPVTNGGSSQQALKSLIEKVGLVEYFPQKLSLRDAIQIREDTIQMSQTSSSTLYPFLILQKIMAFDSKCRLKFHVENKKQSDSDSESDYSEDEVSDSVHPMDGLLALIICSDNFLRQDLFCRLATCQIAVPLLLPYPGPRDPTLLLWAMRSIIKEFKLSDGKTYSARIITYPTPFVSFLKIGQHFMSKSEIINDVMRRTDAYIRNMAFIGYNSPGGTSYKHIVKGLVEVSWYLPGDGLFPIPIAFTNLRGDASHPDLQKQVRFLCSISTVTVALLSLDALQEDAPRGSAIKLLKDLSQAPGGLIILQTKAMKGFKSQVSSCIGEQLFKSKFTVVNCDKSSTVFIENLQAKLRKKLEVPCTQPPLEITAQMCNIDVDENTAACVRGKELMKELYAVIEDYRKKDPRKSPKDLLPLQSNELWHKWAALDKEQFRQKNKYQHQMRKEYRQGKEEHRQQQRKQEWTLREYGEEQRRRMYEIRRKQFPLAIKHNALVSLFINTLKREKRSVLHYYMTWLKFRLDDLSRDTLPLFYVDIRKKRKELSDIQKQHNELAEIKCQDELKKLDHQLINASFGLEHLFREIGQVFEAVTAQPEATNDSHSVIRELPQIAAQLLHDGFPLELLDGDASHIPKKWISMVLNSLADILKREHGFDPHVYILSVLGVQSTGKSTLLNTVFGVQFSISAERYTRGAFMQLIPVHPSLYEKTGVQYFLLIDTEGLRAPELDRLEAHEHDNELATFVIGMANLTLINVCGEVSGDMDDILHTAVHAFLRMNQVQLKPSCHVIHQHVVAVGTEEKMMQGRLKTKDNLDKMTKAAAKETGVETDYTHFSDVIKFDHEKDVSFFPYLWNGQPPMVRVSSAYSEEAQHLKLGVIANSATITKYSLRDIKIHLERLWKAILQEDFVFTFQNTFEIIAFKTLEGKYGDWSWSFKHDMSEWERKAENKLCACTPQKIDGVHAHLLNLLQEFTHKKHLKYEKILIDYFNESNNEVMLKWKPDIESRLLFLRQTLERHAEDYCLQVYQAQRDCTETDNEKGELNTMILGYIQQLAVSLGERKITLNEQIEIFEVRWKQWMKQLTSRIKPFKCSNVAKQVEVCIFDDFKIKCKFLHDKVTDSEPLTYWGARLELVIKECHIMVLQQRTWGTTLVPFWNNPRKASSFFPLAQQHTTSTLVSVEQHLKSIKNSDQNFSPELVTELLHLLQEKKKIDFEGFQLTDEYDADLALTACGYAIRVFEEMAETFRRKHDPKIYVECKMKPQFRKIFCSMYDKVDNEKIVADTLCHQLEEPIKEFVIQSLPSCIISEMRGKYPFIKDKQSFIANILLKIGEKLNDPEQSEEGFKLCTIFVTDVRSSIERWVHHFVHQHCNSSSPSHLSAIAIRELDEIMTLLVNGAKHITYSHAQQQSFSVSQWMQEFNSVVQEGKINVSLLKHQMFNKTQDFSDPNSFTQEVIKRLNETHDKLKQHFSEIEYLDILKQELPHEIIFDMVAGCTKQCPFCKAQCELTGENHSTTGNIKHQTQHRPRCLGGTNWESGGKMVLGVCTYYVSDSTTSFKTKQTDWKWHAYSKYSEIYPEWTIHADKSLESSLYWKWFIGNYSSKIENFFGHERTEVPSEWKELKWSEVKDWLIKEYHL